MRCLFCGNEKTSIKDSRVNEAGERLRRRECEQCGKRFSTREQITSRLPQIVKSDERREHYSEHKLRTSIELALKKRPVATDTIDMLVARCEADMRRMAERELPASWIGQYIMDALRTMDRVAYLRYASVYRAFNDLDGFCLKYVSCTMT